MLINTLRKDYADFLLGWDWDVYWTQTYKNRRNDGCNSALSWWHKMESKLEWTRAFVAVEKHKLGGVHLHALVSDDLIDWTDVSRASRYLDYKVLNSKKYCGKAFGFVSASTARNLATVSLYCAKYVCKDDGDYYFLGDWPKEV